MKMRKINKKGQEEMVGFVLIVVLVIIIGIVFLGISLRNPASNIEKDSKLISSFLGSISSYTTDCEIPQSVNRDIGELISDCYNGEICGDGKTSCEVLETSLKGILNASYIVSNGSYTRYYEMGIRTKDSGRDIIQPIVQGNPLEACPSAKLSNQKQFSSGVSGELIYMSFEVCSNT